MMSWHPRMIDMKLLILGPRVLKLSLAAGQDVEAERHLEIDRGFVKRRRKSGCRSLRCAGLPGIMTPLSPSSFILRRSSIPSSTERIAVCPAPIRRSGCGVAVLRDPQIVGVEARLLVVEVGMIAEDHADAGIDHFGGDAVAILIGHAARWDPIRRDAGLSNFAPIVPQLARHLCRRRRRARSSPDAGNP